MSSDTSDGAHTRHFSAAGSRPASSAAQCVEKLRGLEAIGVDEWIVYLMTEGQDETLEAYGAEIIPAVNS